MTCIATVIRFLWLSLLFNSIGLFGVCVVLANDAQHRVVVFYCLVFGTAGFFLSIALVLLSPYVNALICSTRFEEHLPPPPRPHPPLAPVIAESRETDIPIALTIIETENKIVYAVDIHQFGGYDGQEGREDGHSDQYDSDIVEAVNVV